MTGAPWTDRIGDEDHPYPQARDAAKAFWDGDVILVSRFDTGESALTFWIPNMVESLNRTASYFGGLSLRSGLSRDFIGLAGSVQKLAQGEERLSMTEQELISRGPELLEEVETAEVQNRKLVARDAEHIEDRHIKDEDIVGVLDIWAHNLALVVEVKYELRNLARTLNQDLEARQGHSPLEFP